MPDFIRINSPIVPNEYASLSDAPKFASQGRRYTVEGVEYELVIKKRESYSYGKIALAALAVIVTLGNAMLLKSIRSIIFKQYKNVRFAIPTECFDKLKEAPTPYRLEAKLEKLNSFYFDYLKRRDPDQLKEIIKTYVNSTAEETDVQLLTSFIKEKFDDIDFLISDKDCDEIQRSFIPSAQEKNTRKFCACFLEGQDLATKDRMKTRTAKYMLSAKHLSPLKEAASYAFNHPEEFDENEYRTAVEYFVMSSVSDSIENQRKAIHYVATHLDKFGTSCKEWAFLRAAQAAASGDNSFFSDEAFYAAFIKHYEESKTKPRANAQVTHILLPVLGERFKNHVVASIQSSDMIDEIEGCITLLKRHKYDSQEVEAYLAKKLIERVKQGVGIDESSSGLLMANIGSLSSEDQVLVYHYILWNARDFDLKASAAKYILEKPEAFDDETVKTAKTFQ